MKFLDIKTDYAFKKVFGVEENKDILIEFLNSIVKFPNNNKIKDLTIIDPYNIPMLKGMKDTFVDVKAILDDDSKVIIEMQVLNHEGFEKRVLYNIAKNYSSQLNKGEEYGLLKPVIALTITDFIMFDEFKKYESKFKILEKEEFINYSDDIELIFIELPKFTKKLKDIKSIKDKYIYFIKNVENLEYIPKELKSLKKAFDIINEANLSKEELELQYKRKEFISIQKLAVLKAKNDGLKQGLKQGVKRGMKEGLKEGIKEGLKEGDKKARIEIAKNSLSQGLDIDTIKLITGLSEKEIENLR